MKLVMGVLDVPYEDGGSTTGEVAEKLEDQYHVIEIFYTEYHDRIGQWIADALSDQIQDVSRGAMPHADPFLDGEQKIEQAFRQFLSSAEIERISPDTPTQAALEGKTKRRKSGKGPRRPSFIDTGTYQASFRAWIEDAPVTSDIPF